MTVTLRPLSSDWVWKQYDPQDDNLETMFSTGSSLKASDQWSKCANFPSEIYVELIEKGSIPDPSIGFNEHLVQCSGQTIQFD